MKKFFVILIGVLVSFSFVSCNKECLNTDYNNMSTVSFVVDVFKEGKPITKSFDNENIIETIKLALPKYYNLKLTNLSNNNIYYFDTNNEITIPNGTYSVTLQTLNKNNDRIRWDSLRQYYNNHFGHRCDDSFIYIKCTGGVILCNSPKIAVNDTIEVKNNGNITLNGEINSSAIVWDSNIVERVEIHDESGNNGIFDMKCFIQKDNVCVTFHDDTSWDADIVVYPYENTDFEKKKYTIPNKLTLNYYYIIMPYEVTNSTSSFDVNLGDFTCGGNL